MHDHACHEPLCKNEGTHAITGIIPVVTFADGTTMPSQGRRLLGYACDTHLSKYIDYFSYRTGHEDVLVSGGENARLRDVRLRVTEAEKSWVNQLAHDAGVTASDYIRLLVGLLAERSANPPARHYKVRPFSFAGKYVNGIYVNARGAYIGELYTDPSDQTTVVMTHIVGTDYIPAPDFWGERVITEL